MRGFFGSRGFVILLVVVAVLAVIAGITMSGHGNATAVESVITSIVNPIQTFSVKASNSIIAFFERVFKSTDLDQENEQLRVQLAQFDTMQEELETLREENERLKGLLNFTEITENYSYVTATVIGKSQGVWFSEFTLNAGRRHGISEDMAVINANGLVGKVSSVAASTCKVTSIIDSTSDVSVMVERTRDYAFARGILSPGNEEQLELYYLPTGYDLVPGDSIVTSGIGGVFPKGVAVGTVKEVSRSNDNTEERNAIIDPAVDFLRLEEVMIVMVEEVQE